MDDNELGEFDPAHLVVTEYVRRRAGWTVWDYWTIAADYGGMVPSLTPSELTQETRSRKVQF